MPRIEIARLCQRAEVSFVGMPCGIMDQYISIFGREDMAVQIDCRSLEHRYVPVPPSTAFIAVNTMVKHALAGSAYQTRVRECAEAVERIRQCFPSVESLRDVSPAQLETVAADLPGVIARRARHVITENARVNGFADAAAQGNPEEMGRLMAGSHRSLQLDYEVSCAELDFLVDTALKVEGVYGARMTGGGFGGCIVALLRPGERDRFAAEIASAYDAEFQVAPQIYDCQPSAGAGEIEISGSERAG
jgi:galactokinase